jgi:diguanylate cyclase (GGDEF)-like protein
MAAKFAVMLVVLVVALVTVGLAGLRGLSKLNDHVTKLYGDHIVTLERTDRLAADTDEAAKVALQIVVSNQPADIARFEEDLSNRIVPSVNSHLAALRALHAQDGPAERRQIERLAGLWASFLALRTGKQLDSATSGGPAHDNALASKVRAIFDPIAQQTSQQTGLETAQSAALARQALRSYRGSRTLLIVIAAIAVLIGAAVVTLLTRAVVPRVRRYSDFASRVAAGEARNEVAVAGRDELSELGQALNEMVGRRVSERAREGAQAEFAEVMQLTETEEEAHNLLKHQIERLVPAANVVALNRNNSADRLQASTEVAEDSPLARTLENAKPRSCLAVRFARAHTERLGGDALISCEVCGIAAPYATCEPLLVGGEVIGSVLATHSIPLADDDTQTIKQTVTQAAPVLANLRNLALAERRAETDALTGLPNNRNVTDTVKRMVAHASRTVAPIAALALDLDHFKQINDTYGHGSGDEVLAAVGSTLRTSLRGDDFVGRAGGEEFLILLPNTGVEPAQLVAENIRAAVAEIAVASVPRPITASIGVAVLPDQAGDAASLLRHADRALYAAKRNGRNRTELFTRDMLPRDGAGEGSSPRASARTGALPRDGDGSADGSGGEPDGAARPAARRRATRAR